MDQALAVYSKICAVFPYVKFILPNKGVMFYAGHIVAAYKEVNPSCTFDITLYNVTLGPIVKEQVPPPKSQTHNCSTKPTLYKVHHIPPTKDTSYVIQPSHICNMCNYEKQ